MKLSYNYILLFLFSILSNIHLKLIGSLFLSELFAIIYLFYHRNQIIKLFNEKILKNIILLLLFLLFFQVVSDIYNQSSYFDFLRGWSVIIFSIITTLFLLLFQLNYKNLFISFFLVNIFINLFLKNESLDYSLFETNTNYFKVRYVPFLNPLVIFLSLQFLKKDFNKSIIFILLLSYVIVNFIFDARSNGLIFFFLFLSYYIYTKNLKLTFTRLFSYLTISYFFYILYVNLVLSKLIGGTNSYTQLIKTSNFYNPFEIFLYGRSEFPMLIKSIIDKPWFGHGSWGKDVYGKYSIYLSYISKNKIVVFTDYIRAHSIILGYFSYAGIFAFFVIAYLMFYSYKKVYQLLKANNLSADEIFLLLFFSVSMFWHFFFSPIGLLRTDLPFFLSYILYLNIKRAS